ncbi:hypothetical protein V4S33_08150 [Enterococcus cecorum]
MNKQQTLPLVGLTAYQALFEKMQVKPGESILIHAGAWRFGKYDDSTSKK